MPEAPASIPLLLRALEFAAHKHRDQRRKGRHAMPYINHPIQVARLLADAGVDDAALLCAAVLHDTVEDTETTEAELIAEFGEDIAGLVAEVTDDKALPKHERKQRQIEHAPELSARAALLKLSDKTNNVRDLSRDPPDGWAPERLEQYISWAEQVVAPLRGRNEKLDAAFDEAVRNARVAVTEGRAATSPAPSPPR